MECDFSKLSYAYAITGGIGTGKSLACEILSSLGYAVIDCDLLAHSLLDEQKEEILKRFGKSILSENKKISRAKLGEIVFGCFSKRKELERLLHPLIAKKLYQICGVLEKKQKMYFIEIPLLFECLEEFNFSQTILVYAPKDLQIQRIKNRNGLSEDEIQKRIQSQMDIDEKKLLATWVFQNTSTQDHLRRKILNWIIKKNT